MYMYTDVCIYMYTCICCFVFTYVAYDGFFVQVHKFRIAKDAIQSMVLHWFAFHVEDHPIQSMVAQYACTPNYCNTCKPLIVIAFQIANI